MKNYVVSGLLLISLIHSTSGAVIPIFSDDFESGTMANWTVTSPTTPNPLEAFTPSNAVPSSGRWSAMMNVSTDRMHRNIIADNGGSEATGHLMFSFWIYDDGSTGATGANRVFNELRGHSDGTGLPNGGTVASGALAQLLAAGKFNSATLPGEVFTSTKYQGRVAFHTPQPVGDTGWFNLNDPGSPNRSVGWHRFDIEAMPDGTTFKFYVDGILCRTFTGGTASTYDTVILGPGLGSQAGITWIDGISLGRIDDPPTITCPQDQVVAATSAAGVTVNYPAPTATDDGGVPTVVCNPPSGSTFPPGSTTVTCAATDSANQQARCSFVVRVLVPVDPEIRFPGPQLPPPTGVYISPTDSSVLYANGVIIEDIRHLRIMQSQAPPPPGGSQQHTFDSTIEMRVRTPDGTTTDATANARATVHEIHVLEASGRTYFDTEMLQWDISGGNLPPGVMVRESPTRRSTGQTTLRMDGASAQIGSFFDVFTELSMDGGQSWFSADQSTRLELRRDPSTIPPVPAPSDLLPPPNHFYVTPAQFHAAYAQGIIIRDIRHKYFTQSIPPPPPNGNQIHEFGSQVDMQVSMDGGQSWRPMRAPALTTVALRHVGGGPVCNPCMFETEMLQLEIAGGDLPSGVMLRESPTRRSTGGTTLRHLPDGTAVIHSFFDVFTELSIDGGQSWAGAGAEAHVELTFNAPESPKPTPNLPPLDSEYLSPPDYQAIYGQGIILKDIKHNGFTQTTPPPPPGGSQVHQFGSQVEFQVSMDGGQTFSPGSAPANVAVLVRSSMEQGQARYFDTEMLQLDIAGGSLPAGVRLRESPTRASLGRTSIRRASDSFQISSFFDVFTELSVNNGQSWQASVTDPGSLILNPGPCYHLDCPPDITVYTLAGSKVVNYPTPVFTFTPPCTLPVTPWIQCVPASGSAFPVGTTTVTCQALVSPYAGLATCKFKVIVKPVLIFNFLNSFARITLQMQDGKIEDIGLTGEAEVELDLGEDGSAGDLDGDGLDDAENRMRSLSLQGVSETLGQVRLRLRESPSRGMTEESENRLPGTLDAPPYGQGTADSFFDVFVEIHAGGQVFHTAEPMHMAANLHAVPPARGDSYSETKSHDILNANGTFTGIRWLRGIYFPYPESVDILCPGNVTVVASGPTPVNYGVIPAATDCQPPVISCNPPSGSIFPIGTTPVTCTATDACGNTDECQFFVTVKPTFSQFVNFPKNLLPPPEGMYQALLDVRYDNGVSLRNVVLRNAEPSNPPPGLGDTATHEFDSEASFEWSTDGVSYSPATAPAHVVVQITHTRDEGQTMHFDTEILAMDISGGTLPPEVKLRESPTLRSTGKLLMTPGGSDWQISSFFDVFTELSMDGGINYPFESRDSKMMLQFDPTKIPPMDAPSPKLPPPQGVFVTLPAVQRSYGQGIMIRNVRHRYFSQWQLPPGPGETGLYEFDALVDFMLSRDGGQNWDPVRATAKTGVILQHAGRLLSQDDRPVSIYDTEMLQLDIRGGDLPQGIMLRESPTRRSTGGTALRQMPDGTYEVHSFFDVFTELSFDGGQTWADPPDPDMPARVELQGPSSEVEQPTNLLPPPAGAYAMSPMDPLISYANGAQMLKDFVSQSFSESLPPPPMGQSQLHRFQADVSFQHSGDGGQTWLPYRAIADFLVQVEPLSTNQIHYWGAEILQMNITDGTLPQGVRLRESPTKASLGRTSIRALGGPDTTPVMIDGFFDVFTEITFDGGQTWIPSDIGPANVVLVPKPCLRCPNDYTIQTCQGGTNLCYSLPQLPPQCQGLTVRCQPPPCSFFPANTSTIVTCETLNAAGAPVERCQFTVTVIGDTTPPTITCPPDLAATVDPGQCGRMVNYPLPPATDNCPGVTVSCTPPSGSIFPVGTTTVICTAIDASGNTNRCSWSVTIRDHYPPIITCPPEITVRSCDRQTPVAYAATATDNCPGVTVVCVPPSGSLFPAGSHPVTCTATDASGNSASCSFKVTVIVLPRPKLEITYLPDGRVRICWESECDWRLQCTRSLNPPIMWQFVSAPVTTVGNRHCVTLPAKGAHQFYRLYRREVQDVDAADNLFPPLGTYRSPDDLVTPFFVGGDPDRPLLMRRFAVPIPPDTVRRPPPCPGCPPDLHEIQSRVMFEVSTDNGETWDPYAWPCKWLVGVQSEVPPDDSYEAETVHLEASGNIGPQPVMLRESPTRRSTGQTTIRAEVGTVRIGSFFDVFTEVSMDGGQTWHPADTDVPMDLTKP